MKTTWQADPPKLIHDFFRNAAKRYPTRVAVDVPPNLPARPNRVQVTYFELEAAANRITTWLKPTAQRDAVVAILLPRHRAELYAAQIGVMQSGSAYTCIDPSYPDDHLRWVFEDVSAIALVTDTVGRDRALALGVGCPILVLGDDALSPSVLSRLPGAEVVPISEGQPSDLAYAIYTSGTTGRPKAVLIEHHGVVNLISENLRYFQLSPSDRVAQCSSPAYDSSVEETWLALAAGATLVPLDDEVVRLGPDLVPWLRAERITVLCPPPTLLRATGCEHPDRDLPQLRLLYVGGEPLPVDLANRWATGRHLENGYGPTECTVTVVRGPIHAGEPITIGKPVPGHQAWVLNDDLDEVPPGETGELCIAGVGLARGYRNLAELTADRFPVHPKFGRIYRTGDAVQRTPNGDFVHLGRIDGQVKLRGFRIELGAIEAVLGQCDGVLGAACRVQGEGASRLIAAHIVPVHPDQPPSFETLRNYLGQHLPSFMIPARFALIDRLPTRIGGKLNRDALPVVDGPAFTSTHSLVAPVDQYELDVATVFAKTLGLRGEVSTKDDYFLELGGESITAVQVIIELRKLGYDSVAVRDLYETRTAVALAERLRNSLPDVEQEPAATHPVSVNPLPCTIAQGVFLLLVFIFVSGFGYGLFVELLPMALGELGIVWSLVLGFVTSLIMPIAMFPLSLIVTRLAKWLVLGREQAGRFPVWGAVYFRHWVVTSIARMIPWWLVEETIFKGMALRVLGAKVGERVYLHQGVDVGGGGWDLLTIGDDVTVGCDARITPVEYDRGQLVLAPITLGAGCTLDSRSGLSPGGTLGKNSYLTALSWVPSDGVVADGEQWDGVPATYQRLAPPTPQITGSSLNPIVHGLIMMVLRSGQYAVQYLVLLLLVYTLGVVILEEDGWLTRWLADPELSWLGMLEACLVVMALVPLSLVVQALTVRWMGRVRPGVVSAWSFAAIHIWMKVGLVDAASNWLSGSLYWPLWLRLAGMRIGRRCEISTLINLVPDTVSIGENTFLTDGIYLGTPTLHRGTITIAETSLGRESFVGNQSVVPAGHHWPDGLFLGVSTVPNADEVRPHTAWFGQPPMELPRREVTQADRTETFAPSVIRLVNRVSWETFRIILPTLPLLVGYAWYWCLVMAPVDEITKLLVVAPAVTFAGSVVMCAVALLVKWSLLGRVRPGQHPLWSCWCSRWDFVYMVWDRWGQPPASALQGTLFLNSVLRLTGMKIGRRVVLGPGSAHIVDPDMITLEDDATVYADFQAHTFEDRVLKIDHVHIGPSSTVGAHIVVLYGSKVGERTWVAPHSVIMKRETLKSARRYQGAPTRPQP